MLLMKRIDGEAFRRLVLVQKAKDVCDVRIISVHGNGRATPSCSAGRNFVAKHWRRVSSLGRKEGQIYPDTA